MICIAHNCNDDIVILNCRDQTVEKLNCIFISSTFCVKSHYKTLSHMPSGLMLTILYMRPEKALTSPKLLRPHATLKGSRGQFFYNAYANREGSDEARLMNAYTNREDSDEIRTINAYTNREGSINAYTNREGSINAYTTWEGPDEIKTNNAYTTREGCDDIRTVIAYTIREGPYEIN